MSPFEVLQWIGVGFAGVVAFGIGVLIVKSVVVYDPKNPAPEKKTNDDGRNVDL